MIAVASQPRIVDASVDRQGRLSLTFRLDKRLYQTVRLDKLVSFNVKTTHDYIDCPNPMKIGSHTTGSINFISDKVSISNRKPKR